MIKVERTDAPEWLLENWEQWGKDYEESEKFEWRFGPKKKRELTDLLKKMTAHHCSYCDSFPLGKRQIKDTIDHFRPKEIFKLWAYLWGNLFIACHYCQERGSRFDERLLKPDEENYGFDEYFMFDFTTFKIVPNPLKSKENQERAQITIDLFRLNGQPEDAGTTEDCMIERERIYEKYKNDPDIDCLPYRFMFR